MKNKTKYTISEASKLLGFSSRSTLNKKTKEGVVSYERDSNGVKVIDASELARVFPDEYTSAANSTSDAPSTPHKKIQENTPASTPESAAIINLLNKTIERLEQDIKREREEKTERENRLYSEKNELMTLVKNQNLMLTHHKSEPEKNLKFYQKYKVTIVTFLTIIGTVVALFLLLYFMKG